MVKLCVRRHLPEADDVGVRERTDKKRRGRFCFRYED